MPEKFFRFVFFYYRLDLNELNLENTDDDMY